MFPEYRNLISKLKTEDHHVRRVVDEHNELDEKIAQMEKQEKPVPDDEIEALKKQKLALKDDIYQILHKAATQQ